MVDAAIPHLYTLSNEVDAAMGIAAIQIDSREPAHIRNLAFGGAPKIVTLLPAGDVLVATTDGYLLGIERKESSDLLNTIAQSRLFPQLLRLRETTEWAYLVITGDLRPTSDGHCYANGQRREWRWGDVQGALTSAQEMGVGVVWDDDFEAAVVRLANRSRAAMRLSPLREAAFIHESEAVLAALPAIGPDRAASIAAVYPEPIWALAYLTVPDRYWELDKVTGIGDGVKRRVRKALGLDDGMCVTIGRYDERENT